MNADAVLAEAIATIQERGVDYDAAGGERSMARTVDIFRAITGIELTEQQGWKFMQAVKLARAAHSRPKRDTFVDLAAFAALEGECALGASK
jgi:Domain of unknown function (DUF6378)